VTGDMRRDEEPRAFDGYEYRVTRRDGRVFEGCHAMPSFSGKSVVMVVPAVNGEGGALAGDIRDRAVVSVERTGIHKESWLSGGHGGGQPR
jgi:hypothetical protein